MNETEKTENSAQESMKSNKPKTKRSKGIILAISLIVLGIGVLLASTYFLYLRPKLQRSVGDRIELSQNPVRVKREAYYNADEATKAELLKDIQFPSNLDTPPLLSEKGQNDGKPVCGNDASWMFLLVGVDQGSGYWYGLADVIRLVRIDFVNQKMNMVALPRDMIIEMPAGTFLIESPMKINQSYLTGTEGWTGKVGQGNGALTLAEAIDYNLGVAAQHYVVVNFEAVESIIDAVGGVEVDLPYMVQDEDWGGFPSGKQWLDGERALDLMRIRKAYSDSFRVANQTIVMNALFQKLKSPAMILKVPGLVEQFSKNVLTDLNPEQLISVGTCFLTKFGLDAIQSHQIPEEYLTADSAYLPSIGDNSYVYRWGQDAVQFIHNALMQ